jgi:hypothetical protein
MMNIPRRAVTDQNGVWLPKWVLVPIISALSALLTGGSVYATMHNGNSDTDKRLERVEETLPRVAAIEDHLKNIDERTNRIEQKLDESMEPPRH